MTSELETYDVSIITPSFQQSEWLKCCVASVADQVGVRVEHIVQDAGSTDGTLAWLGADRRVRAFVEQDSGMYDAINRGLRRARADIVAYLNCDEQYLPGTLSRVVEVFALRPELDVLFGDVLVLDATGQLVTQRKVVLPRAAHVTLSHLPVLSCAMFMRRRLFEKHGELSFDTRYKAIADARWVLRCLSLGVRMDVLPRFLSVFTLTGANLSDSDRACLERSQLRAEAPAWLRAIKPLIIAQHRVRRLVRGAYWPQPVEYAVYTASHVERRQRFRAARATGIWPVPHAG